MRKLVLVFIFSAFLVFRWLFFGSIFWGDAPHFFPEAISQFQHEPLTWTSLGNNFGGVNLPLWLYPLMFLWRYIPPQLLFVFSSIMLSAVGSWLFAKYLKFGAVAQFLTAFVYTFNTYFLLLIDGGQMGVALSYGLFPFSILFLKKFVDLPKFKSFYPALIALVLTGLADPRIALISVVTIIVWNITSIANPENRKRKLADEWIKTQNKSVGFGMKLEDATCVSSWSFIKKILYLVPLGSVWLLANSFWIVPFILNKDGLSSLGALDVSPVKFYDPFLLFSPHYPDNLFGKINSPPVYFLIVPLLVMCGFLISRKLRNLEYFLLYFFFSIISIVPIGVIFRDSTKFYIPVILFAAILIGWGIETTKNKLIAALTVLFILFLVHPTILGKMNFVLSGRKPSRDFVTVYNKLKGESGFFRTVWVPERNPMTFETEEKPAIDAKDLTKVIPFRSFNIGEDPFNFLNNAEFIDDFRTLGVRYLLLSGNPREVSKSETEKKNWDNLTGMVSKAKGLKKVDWGVSFPVYEVTDTYPHFFEVSKLIGVVGAPISMKYPAVYLEDGKVSPSAFKEVDPGSFTIFLNNKDKKDLTMSFLTNYFLFPKDAKTSQWGIFDPTQYLKYKYQLLIRGINFTDFDYGGGIAFSSIKGEKIVFNFSIPAEGDYVLAMRTMTKGDKSLTWKIEEPKHYAKGNSSYTLTNNSDLEVLNTLALIPLDDFKKSEDLSEDFLKRFGSISKNELDNFTAIKTLNYRKIDTLKYKFDSPDGNGWIIFTDSFNPLWSAKGGSTLLHVPVYSMVNGFYVDGSHGFEISYGGQNNFRFGVLLSLATLATLVITYLVYAKLLKRNPAN